MGYHRFEDILRALVFSDSDGDDDQEQGREEADKWSLVRQFVDSCNTTWQEALRPGYKITVDESMFAWYGKGDRPGGLPRVIKIKRKPKGVGCEAKTIADALSGIMIGIELNEGKEECKKALAFYSRSNNVHHSSVYPAMAWKRQDCGRRLLV